MSAPVPQGKWSWKYKYCFHCGTTKVKHKGWGLCLNCHDKLRAQTPKRKANVLKTHRAFVKRNKWKDSFKKNSCERSRRYYQKNKDNPEFMEKLRKSNLESYYRLKGTPKRIHQQRVWQRRSRLKQYYKEFIKGNSFYLKKFKDGLQFRCDGCLKNCLITSPVKPSHTTGVETENNLVKLSIFKTLLIRTCLKTNNL